MLPVYFGFDRFFLWYLVVLILRSSKIQQKLGPLQEVKLSFKVGEEIWAHILEVGKKLWVR